MRTSERSTFHKGQQALGSYRMPVACYVSGISDRLREG